MGVDAQNRPDDEGARFADQRAASLRRMFPHHPAAMPATSPPPAPAPPRSPVAGSRRRRVWPAVAGGVILLAAAGVVAALRVTGGGFFEVPAEGAPVAASLAVARPPSLPASPGPGPAGLTVTGYSACSTGGSVAFKATFSGSSRFRQVFIDADRDTETGYRIPQAGGFGADYLIENDRLYRSADPGGWSWRPVKGADPLVSVTGGSYRWVVEARYGGVRVVFTESDGADSADARYTPVVRVAAC
ncbi:hypothetical protein [Actinoplanes sp. NPDC049802]|uniref:hypothetical protein n=1 Tax=Actinoplanes sp. NPDC049802 TaxID=3154742 RepID=UPI0033F75841